MNTAVTPKTNVGITSVLRRYCVGALAVFALPATAQACAQLSANVWLCDRGTAWETAQWDPYGDGTTLLLGDVIFNFTEDFPGADIADDLSTLEERYATYAQWVATDGGGPIEVLQVDTLTTDHATTLRHIQRDQFEYAPETMSAVMLADVSDTRIMLYLDAPREMAQPQMDAMSREVAELLRATCADEISCAEGYERPGADLKED